MTTPITRKQLMAINAELKRQGLQHRKTELIELYTNGRTDHDAEMYIGEARTLLSKLYNTKPDMNVSTRLMSKLFAMAIEIGWCPLQQQVQKNGLIKQERNYSRLHGWVEKYGYLKKPLREYSYNELPKLVSIFEAKIYNTYIENISNK